MGEYGQRPPGGVVRDAARLLPQRHRAHVQLLYGVHGADGEQPFGGHGQGVGEGRGVEGC